MSLPIISVLIFLVLAAAWQDYQNYRIGNFLVISGSLLGILLNIFLPAGLGLSDSLIGWCIGLLLLLPVYLLRLMGAGDVKLLAMVGAFVGLQAIMVIFLYVMISGGLLAMGVAWHRCVLSKLLCNMRVFLYELIISLFIPKSKLLPLLYSLSERTLESTTKLPYGIAIAIGTTVFLATNFN